MFGKLLLMLDYCQLPVFLQYHIVDGQCCVILACLKIFRNLPSLTQKLKKLQMLLEKIYAFCFRIFTGMSLMWTALSVLIFFNFLRYIINTNTWKLKRSPMVTLLVTMMLPCLVYLKIAFNIGCDVFQQSVELFTFWDLQVFNYVEEKAVHVFCMFSIFYKKFIIFYKRDFFLA